ncbi:hypothetical protein J7E99_35120 [Streptomyces sp. ISL-44]|nr:hypothetical protein [Streptomyces sp. ISL-44]
MRVDIKKLGNIPDGGGRRVVGRAAGDRNLQAATDQRKSSTAVIGYSYIHSAVDDRSCLAYKARSCPTNASTPPSASGSGRTSTFTAHGITVERSRPATALAASPRGFTQALTEVGITHKRTRPDLPQTNGDPFVWWGRVFGDFPACAVWPPGRGHAK